MVAMAGNLAARRMRNQRASLSRGGEAAPGTEVTTTRLKSIPPPRHGGLHMRLLRIGEAGAERPVVERDEVWFDAGSVTADYDGSFFAGGGAARLRGALDRGELPEIPRDDVRIGAPVARPGKIVCIGLNYRDHAEET